MTYWLKNCRSASSPAVCTSRTSARRSRSASDPESTATAKRPATFKADRVLRHADPREVAAELDAHDGVEQARGLAELRQDDGAVHQRAERRHLQGAAAELERAGGHDGQDVERREQAADAAGQRDRRRHHEHVDGEVHVGQPREPIDEAQRGDEGEADRVDEGDEDEQRVDVEDARQPHLDDEGGAEEDCRRHQPQRDVRQQAAGERAGHPASSEISPKIGRYIEMTIPPTTRPSQAIMTGSSSVSMPATAVSTSSS